LSDNPITHEEESDKIMFHSVNTRPESLWRQVWGLAALLAAMILSWMAYNFYQPIILQKLAFVELIGWLGILQGLLAAFIEPMIGGLSDRIQQRWGSRLPMISVGVVLAGLIFVTVSLLVEQNLSTDIRWIVPVLMTAWVMTIIIFRSPAIALLTQLVPTTELPQANALLVFVLGAIRATEPLLNTVLHSMGASLTFLLGAIALVLGAYILRSLTPKNSFYPSRSTHDQSVNTPVEMLVVIFVIGLATGVEVNLLLSIFPQQLQKQLPNLTVEFITSAILLVSAIASIPLGDWTDKRCADKSILLGLGTMTALMGLAVLNDSHTLVIGFILAFGISLSLVIISILPVILAKFHPSNLGLGTGLYFGGTAGGTALVSLLIQEVGITSIAAFLLAEVALIVVVVCIVMSRKLCILHD
jgi:MFS family permease